MTEMKRKKSLMMIGTDSITVLIGDFSFCYSIVIMAG